MRILILSKALIFSAYHKLLEELAKHKDIELIVITPNEFMGQKAEEVNPKTYSLIRTDFLFQNYHHLFTPNPLFLTKMIRDLKPDILHLDEEPYNLITTISSLLTKILSPKTKIFFYAYQNIYKNYSPPVKLSQSLVFKFSDCAIAGNEEAKNVLRKQGFNKEIFVHYQFGVDPEIFKKKNVNKLKHQLGIKDEFVIGYIGRLAKEKGIGTLIKAFSEIKKNNVRLLIVGSGPENEWLRKMAGELGVEEKVVFVDWLPSDKVPDYINCLDILVLPSKTTEEWKEQYGRILVEAMACEKPVIGSNSGEIPNVIGRGNNSGGLIFEEDKVEDLKEKILYLMKNKKFYRKLAKQARKRVLNNFTQKTIADKYYNVYKKLMKYKIRGNAPYNPH